MKKYLIFALLFFVYNSVNALEFYSENQTRFYFNEIKQISPITIKQTQDLEITKQNGIQIFIGENDKLRFNNYTLSGITISGNALNKVDKIFIQSNLLKLDIILKEDFIKNDYIKLSNIELIAYDREQGNRFLSIDISGDQVSDLIDINGLKVESGNNRTDNFSPNEVFNLTGSLNNSGTILYLSWINPGDLDFNGVKIESLDINNNVLKEEFIYSTGITLNITENIKTVFVKTFDKRGNTSNGIEYKISKVVEEKQQNKTETKQIETNTKEEQIEIKDENEDNKEEQKQEENIVDKEEIIINKLTPEFKTKSFSDFMIKFDKMLDKKEYKKEIRIIRNDIIKLLKDYEDRKVLKNFVVSELRRLVLEFRKVW